MNTLTITGPPQSGKSRLALDIARHLAARGLTVTLVDDGGSVGLGPPGAEPPAVAIRTRTLNARSAEAAAPDAAAGEGAAS